jgi:biofilm PGA synthesis lipoprotein PgaB
LALHVLGSPSLAAAAPTVAILCYHEVTRAAPKRLETVTPEFLRNQIRASKRNGWTFLSLSELLASRGRMETLPPRVMVLVFDDGYRSFEELVLPILREENVKATVAVVSAFVEHPPRDLSPLLDWNGIRRVERSGRVEIASHTHDLHRYETCNAYRDTWPSATTRRYLLREARYENRDEYRARIRADLVRSQEILTRKLGHPVPVLVWPYGEHNRLARDLASQAGFSFTLALGWREALPADFALRCLPRIQVWRTMDFSSRDGWIRAPRAAWRAVRIDLDRLYDADPTTFRNRLDATVARARALGATHAILQGCPDPDGNGMIRQTYFMNHQIPVKADVWSMVAAKLAQARIRTWIRAPSMNLSWAWDRHPEWRIPLQPRGSDERMPRYFRLAPDLPEARRAAMDFYTDIAVYLPIQGVVFDDDVFMTGAESPAGTPSSDPAAKAAAMRGYLEEIETTVRAWRPGCLFARTVAPAVVERAGLHPDYAQDLDAIMREEDLVVVDAGTNGAAIGSLAAEAVRRWRAASPSGVPPVMIVLDALDETTGRWSTAAELIDAARRARQAGIAHLGLGPLVPDRGEWPDRLLEGAAPQKNGTVKQ